MKRKTILITLCLVMAAVIVGTFAIPVLAKTDYSDGAQSLIVNCLKADGSVDWSYTYNGNNPLTYTAPDNYQYVYYNYPTLNSLADYYYYATIDAMPAAVGTKAKGVLIQDLVDDANANKPAGDHADISWESGYKFALYATDAPGVPYQSSNFYTYDFVQNQDENPTRFYYPYLVEKYTAYQASLDPDDLDGWDEDSERADPVLCVSSYQARYATDTILGNNPTMDSKESLRFCMGLTHDEALAGINGTYSSTNKFCRWVNRIDFGPVNTPVLTPDTTNNMISTAIDITFTDNTTWRNAITGVTVDGVPASPSITAGNIQFSSLARGARAIAVSATGYPVDCVTQNIYETAPTLTADTSNNDTTNQIDITFTDNSAWRTAFIGLTVDGDEVTSGYTVSSGHIIFDAGVLAAGSHTIRVSANYFLDANVTQVIN
jgi:hypothetical protein